MCGIFGYIGPDDSASICIEGLKNLEYRGYDSSGIAGISNGNLLSCKEVGKIDALENAIQSLTPRMELAIAHTRWATHGIASKMNAHPQIDQNNTVAVVHNGIIENHHTLRKMLTSKGIVFHSDTDTEVIAQLIAYNYTDDIYKAVQKTIESLQGTWALAIIHKNHPDQIIAVSKEAPLVIAQDKDRAHTYVSSDPNAFSAKDLDIFYLEQNEVAVLKSGSVDVFDKANSPIMKSLERLGIENIISSKNGYEHYMLKEIYEQPEAVRNALKNRLKYEFGTVEFENFKFSPEELLRVKRILILACGSSYHAGLIASSLFESKARIPTQVEIASEFRYKNPIISSDTLVIAISQSGETLDTIISIREAKAKGAKILGICNVPNSTIVRESYSTLFLKAGPEISVCSTKAFTSQITVLSLFALYLARLHHMSKEEGQQFIEELCNLPDKITQVLQEQIKFQKAAEQFAHLDHFFFIGRHYMYPTSLEGSLKLKEIAYVNAVGYPAGEMKHGPLALVDEKLLTVLLCGNKLTYEKLLSNGMEVKSRNGPMLIFAPQNAIDIDTVSSNCIYLPIICDELAPVLYSVACQLFAYHIALVRKTDIDKPRNLAKSVTVE